MHRRRRSKIWWLNAAALCLMAAGVVLAFAGRNILRWVPPPIPSASAAPQHRAGGHIQGAGTPGRPTPVPGPRSPRLPRSALPS